MVSRYAYDRGDLIQRLAILGGRFLLGVGLALVLSMAALAVAWALFIFVGATERSTFMIMSMSGAGFGAALGVNVAWIRLDRQRWLPFVLMLAVTLAGAILVGLAGYQYGANREIECCAEPRTTPFTYTAFGAMFGANAALYLATAALAIIRKQRGQRVGPTA